MQDNFTRLNFGWLGYRLPDEKTIGTQPDQLEFVSSKAAAWDCPISLHATPESMALHPRTADNFEVVKRWEDVRAAKWLTDEQKKMLRDPNQEFILLLDEQNNFELVACNEVKQAVGGCREVIAFTFERPDAFYAVYWHTSADQHLEIPLEPESFVLLERLGATSKMTAGEQANTSIVPIGNRRYLKVNKSESAKLIAALEKARLL